MPSKQETTLTLETIERFRTSLYGKGRSANTLKAYTTDLKEFLKWAQRDIPPEILEECAQNWLNQYRRTVAPRTTGRRVTSIRAYAKWAGLTEVLSDYTAPTPARSQPHPIPEGIEGVLKMIEQARDNRQKALVALTGLVGCRVSEALTVGPESFDYHQRTLTIRGKGDKTRVVPLSRLAWTHLATAVAEAILNQNPYIVGYKDRFARQVISSLAVKAGLKRHTASHDMRATLATEMHNRSKNLRAVQEYLGHASSHTTEVYTGVSHQQMRDGVEFEVEGDDDE